jgi:hypothetical protein
MPTQNKYGGEPPKEYSGGPQLVIRDSLMTFMMRAKIHLPRHRQIEATIVLVPLLHFVGIAATSHGLPVCSITKWLILNGTQGPNAWWRLRYLSTEAIKRLEDATPYIPSSSTSFHFFLVSSCSHIISPCRRHRIFDLFLAT